jgi:hypothetical protein
MLSSMEVDEFPYRREIQQQSYATEMNHDIQMSDTDMEASDAEEKIEYPQQEFYLPAKVIIRYGFQAPLFPAPAGKVLLYSNNYADSYQISEVWTSIPDPVVANTTANSTSSQTTVAANTSAFEGALVENSTIERLTAHHVISAPLNPTSLPSPRSSV